MSELTSCNYCNLKSMQKRHGKNLLRKGNDFYVKDGRGKHTIKGHKARFIAWLMEITDHCCC